MKYKTLVLQKLERLENQVNVVRSGRRNFRDAEEESRAWEQLKTNIEDIITLINQNSEE